MPEEHFCGCPTVVSVRSAVVCAPRHLLPRTEGPQRTHRKGSESLRPYDMAQAYGRRQGRKEASSGDKQPLLRLLDEGGT